LQVLASGPFPYVVFNPALLNVLQDSPGYHVNRGLYSVVNVLSWSVGCRLFCILLYNILYPLYPLVNTLKILYSCWFQGL
jgi:hypothetical protein